MTIQAPMARGNEAGSSAVHCDNEAWQGMVIQLQQRIIDGLLRELARQRAKKRRLHGENRRLRKEVKRLDWECSRLAVNNLPPLGAMMERGGQI